MKEYKNKGIALAIKLVDREARRLGWLDYSRNNYTVEEIVAQVTKRAEKECQASQNTRFSD